MTPGLSRAPALKSMPSPPQEGTHPYPPRFTFPQVKAWVIAGLTDKPPMPGLGEAAADVRMRRLVEKHVSDREHREQLKAWARAQADEGAFRQACRLRGWNRTTALRHVDLALGAIYLIMCRPDFGRL